MANRESLKQRLCVAQLQWKSASDARRNAEKTEKEARERWQKALDAYLDEEKIKPEERDLAKELLKTQLKNVEERDRLVKKCNEIRVMLSQPVVVSNKEKKLLAEQHNAMVKCRDMLNERIFDFNIKQQLKRRR